MAKCFDGIKVLDFTNNIAGPTAVAMLADFGADVIKIEKPKLGDDARAYMPKLSDRSVVELWLNRGKRSLEVALDDPEAVEIVLKLIKVTDIIVEAFRPGTMKKYGLDYENVKKINPGIIYCSISNFGQNGPLASVGGYDTIVQATSGMMDMTGEKGGSPTKIGFPVVDYATAHNAFGGIAVALYYREKTGIGQMVDIGLFNCGLAMNHFVEQTSIGIPTTRKGNLSEVISPCGIYTAKCGSLVIMANNKMWPTICKCMNRPDLEVDPRYSTAQNRAANAYEIKKIMEEWLEMYDDIDIPDQILQKSGIPCHKVNTNQEAIDLALEAGNGAIDNLMLDESLGQESIKARGVHIILSETPGKLAKASPELGQNTEEILLELGYSKEKVDELIARWKK